MALAGGVRPEDLQTGRAARLRDASVQRTLGTKLNSATTLFDYIYRAMPWTNPMSLSVDDTYAVTAYVLHLNDIVAADFVLSDRNIVALPMPNRSGMTRAHGMGSVRGTPDVQGRLCMVDCVAQVRITSELPDYAKDAHGDLAQQFRPIGPKGAVQTSVANAPAAAITAAAVTGAGSAAPAELLSRNACLACHHASNRVVGPSFREVGARHASRSDAEDYIARKIREGGSGAWGPIPMPAQPALQAAEAQAIARWILGGAIQ
jgi:cytochrome c